MPLTQTTKLPYPTRLEAPWRITFDTNPDDCNLHCIMCEEHSYYHQKNPVRLLSKKNRRRMKIKMILRVIEECVPYGLREIIPSTMGEPLLYKHFPEIINICIDYNVRLNLTTNGTFPGLDAIKWAELIVPVTSDVKFSWNGVSKEVQENVMIGTRLEHRFEKLKTFLNVRDKFASKGENYCSVTLQMTFMEINLKEIAKVVELAIGLGVDRVKGHHLWVHFDEIKDQCLRRSPDSIKRWNTVVRECHSIAKANPLPSGKYIGLENFNELDPHNREELHPDAICKFLGKEAWINYKGRFDPCCAPNNLRKNLGYFGNVKEGGFLKIWRSDVYETLCHHYLENRLCRRCNMRVLPRFCK